MKHTTDKPAKAPKTYFYDVDIEIKTSFSGIEAENKEEAKRLVKDVIFEDWNIELVDSEIIKIERR